MARKKAARKDGWTYYIDGNDESYYIHPTFEAARKSAVKEVEEYGYDGTGDSSVRVEFYQLAKVVDFTRTVTEVPVMTKKVKVEVK